METQTNSSAVQKSPGLSVFVGLALVLTACTQAAPPPEPPTPPVNGIKALVYGPVESTFLESLKPTLSLVQYDAGQKLEDYSLLILDGDAHTPASLKEDALVQGALRTGMWVLAVDVTAEHKRDGLGQFLHAASLSTSPAYAMHVGRDTRGRHEVRVVEYPGSGEVTYRQGGLAKGIPGMAQPAPPPDLPPASAFADLLLERLSTPVAARVQSLTADIPDDLIYATYYFSQVQNWSVGNDGRHSALQHPNYTANYTFTIFLNNKANPQGDFQFVLLDADVSASPKSASEAFLAPGTHSSSNWCVPCFDEWGYFQDRMTVQSQPAADDWVTVDTSPDTVNGQTTVTSGVNFTIGFNQAQGGFGSFGYTNSTTRNITDWKATNSSTGKVAWWYYRTRYPLDADADEGCGPDQPIWRSGCYVSSAPNDLSINALSLRTQAVWRTPKSMNSWTDFAVWTQHGMVDLYCNNNFGVGCSDSRYQGALHDAKNTYSVNLGAVIPIPIQSLTFSSNPIKGGTAVTGTVTLKSPAQVDTEVKISSSSQNATVLPKVTVKQGQTSATFQVLTNTDALPAGGTVVATITAFYAQDFQAQLTVTD